LTSQSRLKFFTFDAKKRKSLAALDEKLWTESFTHQSNGMNIFVGGLSYGLRYVTKKQVVEKGFLSCMILRQDSVTRDKLNGPVDKICLRRPNYFPHNFVSCFQAQKAAIKGCVFGLSIRVVRWSHPTLN